MSFLALNNPVMQAELKHQRHIITTSRSGWFWIVLAMLMLIPALLTALVMLAGAFAGIHLEPIFTQGALAVVAQVGLTSLMIMHFALYIVVTLVTLALAGASISREQTSGTWESLLLTNMTARQIVQGKWWATLRSLWGDHLMVLLVRLGFVAWLDYLGSAPDLPNPGRLLVGLIVISAFSIADSALTVILGILPPVSGRNPVVLTLALGLRLMVSLVILGVSTGIGLLVHEWNPPLVAGAAAGMAVYLLGTAGMLRFAEWAAVRSRVSPTKPAASK